MASLLITHVPSIGLTQTHWNNKHQCVPTCGQCPTGRPTPLRSGAQVHGSLFPTHLALRLKSEIPKWSIPLIISICLPTGTMAIMCRWANRGLKPRRALQALRTGSPGAFGERGSGRAGWRAPTESRRSFVCGQALLTHQMDSPGASGIKPVSPAPGSILTVPATELLHFIR